MSDSWYERNKRQILNARKQRYKSMSTSERAKVSAENAQRAKRKRINDAQSVAQALGGVCATCAVNLSNPTNYIILPAYGRAIAINTFTQVWTAEQREQAINDGAQLLCQNCRGT